MDPVPVALAQGHGEVAEFLAITQGFVNPRLQYAQHMSVAEARYWLTTEKLRDFSVGVPSPCGVVSYSRQLKAPRTQRSLFG